MLSAFTLCVDNILNAAKTKAAIITIAIIFFKLSSLQHWNSFLIRYFLVIKVFIFIRFYVSCFATSGDELMEGHGS